MFHKGHMLMSTFMCIVEGNIAWPRNQKGDAIIT